jgi:hypothetical protein
VVLLDQTMNPGYQRAGGIDGSQAGGLGSTFRFQGDTMGTEYTDPAGRNIVQIFDESGAELFQLGEDVTVMDDFVQDEDRGAFVLQG